ncbi:MAG: transposase [Chloroflexi bacterium]|nr:transposase [Chloroflexota bacterium]
MKAFAIFGRIPNYWRWLRMLSSLRHFEQSEIAQRRLEIIQFYEQFGEAATQQAFGADRKVISRWRQRLTRSQGQLQALIPRSTRPHRVRRSAIPPEIIEFIRALREKYPRMGKDKIKLFLDRFCHAHGFHCLSVSTIGNVIKKHRLFFYRSGRLYHDPGSAWAQKNARKIKRFRVRKSPTPQAYGYVLSDTVERIVDGIKYYFYNGIDAKMKFALTLMYPRLNSQNNQDFYQRFKRVYPWEIHIWQTDNGKENLGDFESALEKDHVPHVFSYPHCPKINAFIERYNRTIQEEFIDNHLELLTDPKLFAAELADYLIFYNSQRPHQSLNMLSPLDDLVQKGLMSQMSLTSTLATQYSVVGKRLQRQFSSICLLSFPNTRLRAL